MDEKTQRQLEAQFAYISSQIEEAQRQLSELKMAIQEVQETVMGLIELSEEKPKTTMVSLGGNAFIPAKLDTGKAIVPIGANVLAMKTPAEARQILENRLSKLSASASNIEKTLMQFLQMRRQLVELAQREERK